MKNNLITISNNLVVARYDLEVVGKKLLLALVSKIDNNICKDEGNERDRLEIIDSANLYELTAQQYAEFCNIDLETAKDELPIAAAHLFEGKVMYNQKDGGMVTTRWISTLIQYTSETHSIKIRWSEEIIPLISELRTNFSTYKIKFLGLLASMYSIRLYEIFIMELSKSKKHAIILWLDVEYLMNIFALEGKYEKFDNFMRRVIKTPIEEINKKTNISISFLDEYGKKLYRKQGKKVVSVGFAINRRN